MTLPSCHYYARMSTLRDHHSQAIHPHNSISSISSFPLCVEATSTLSQPVERHCSEFGHGGPLPNLIGRYIVLVLFFQFVFCTCLVIFSSNSLLQLFFYPQTLPFCPIDGREVHLHVARDFVQLQFGNFTDSIPQDPWGLIVFCRFLNS